MSTADPKLTRDLPKTAKWHRKDLLGIRELELGEIEAILDTAAAFKTVGSRDIKKVPALRGFRSSFQLFVSAPMWSISHRRRRACKKVKRLRTPR